LKGLRADETISLSDVIKRDPFVHLQEDDVVMFNPMGMAIFDIAIAAYYFDQALKNNYGVLVEDDKNYTVAL